MDKLYCVYTNPAKDYSTYKLKSTIRDYCKDMKINFRDNMNALNRFPVTIERKYSPIIRFNNYIKEMMYNKSAGGVLYLSTDEATIKLAVMELIVQTGAHIEFKEINEKHFTIGTDEYNKYFLPFLYKKATGKPNWYYHALKRQLGYIDLEINDILNMSDKTLNTKIKPKLNGYFSGDNFYKVKLIIGIINEYRVLNP